jgi:phosphomannomutase/phosphoglucomutase
MFFGGDWFGFDDAVFAAARLLHAVARQPGPLSVLLGTLPATVTTPEIRIECADDRKFAIVAGAAEHFGQRYPISRLDGARIRFPQGWGLLRASNTQPVLVLRFEAPSDETLARNRDEVETWLRGAGVSV